MCNLNLNDRYGLKLVLRFFRRKIVLEIKIVRIFVRYFNCEWLGDSYYIFNS